MPAIVKPFAPPASKLRHRFDSVRAWLASPAGERAKRVGSIALSVIILAVLVRALWTIPRAQLVAALGAGALSWGLFLASYATQPLCEWAMFRRWWRLHVADIGAFLRKRVLNEAVVSYGGDAWLGLWASERLGFDMVTEAREMGPRGSGAGRGPRGSPLAAIKDSAIMSGLSGNLFTVLNLALVALIADPAVISGLIDPATLQRIGVGFALLVTLSLLILANRGRVLSLAMPFNRAAFFWHLGRVTVSHLLLLASWWAALPAIGLDTWLLLGAIRLVTTRMPVPNKEVLFGALAAALVGPSSTAVAALMAVQGAAWLAAHGLSWGLALAMKGPEQRPEPVH